MDPNLDVERKQKRPNEFAILPDLKLDGPNPARRPKRLLHEMAMNQGRPE